MQVLAGTNRRRIILTIFPKVRLEMSAIRGLFQFALEMAPADVMINLARNMKVRKANNGVSEDY